MILVFDLVHYGGGGYGCLVLFVYTHIVVVFSNDRFAVFLVYFQQGNMCSVYLYKQGREVDFPINVIQLVTPQKQDKVSI